MSAPIRFKSTTDDGYQWDDNIINFKGYNGSPNLKRSGVQVGFTQEMIDEWKKCKDDILYFSERYIKIVHVDHGLIPIRLYDYQKTIIQNFVNNRRSLAVTGRQQGKTTTATCIILHYMLFNEHKLVGLLANKGEAALEIMSRIQLAYEYLPKWLQSGVVEWNKGSVELENGCKVIASATSGSSIRGKSCVSGDTLVTIRNKTTGVIQDIEIEKLDDVSEFEIFDGTSFQDFDGILTQEKELFHIVCENGSVDATADHRLLTEDDQWVYVDELVSGMVLKGAGKYISQSSIGMGTVYDPLNVANTNQYKSNNFISHNCALVYLDECVAGDTLVTVRDTFSSEVEKLQVEKLAGMLPDLHNDRYEVLTDSGFQDFSGIKKAIAKTLLLKFSDDSHLRCTYSHKILVQGEFKEAHTLKNGDVIQNGVFITEIVDDAQEIEVFDLLDVENGNHYITNSVTSHNCAFVENFTEFWASTYPTISSGNTTKLLFTSTPKGLNHFYKFVVDAKAGRNGFAWTEVKWDQVPGRDEAWKHETLAALSFDYEKFAQEYECEFQGSSGTLIAGATLKTLVHQQPIYEWEGFSQYEPPKENNIYTIICDVSRGKGLDYSAFHVIDITKMPYRQVATYRSNGITPTDYAAVIHRIGTLYNTAYVLVEINDIGGQVTELLFEVYDYDELLYTTSGGKNSGKVLCSGGYQAERGVRTTTSVKKKGCSILKLLIEQQQLIINDFHTINELSRFSKKGTSYEAEDGHDDLVMGLVLFAWMTTNPHFVNISDTNAMHFLGDDSAHLEDCMPFGFIVDGREDDVEVDAAGNIWQTLSNSWLLK